MRPVLLIAFLALQVSRLSGQTGELDFRFAPASWFTAICFPGDWQKSVVTSGGTLGTDFAPGPYARPTTEISFGAKGRSLTPASVTLESPRVPVATAQMSDGTIAIEQKIFSILPPGPQVPAHSFLGGTLERMEGLAGSASWASPPDGTDPAFRGTAWGVNRPVKYRVRVAPGSKHQVVLGLCEPYKTLPGKRLLVLRVEGAGDVIADPVREGKTNVPYIHRFNAQDRDNNGWLTIEAHAAMDSPDPNVILNVIWMFRTDVPLDDAAIISGRLTERAEVYWPCGTEIDAQPVIHRADALLASFPGDTVTPTLVIRTRRLLEFDSTTGTVLTNGRPYVFCFPPATGAERADGALILGFPEGTTAVSAVVMHGAPGRPDEFPATSLPAALEDARAFWQQRSGLPYGRIVLPDSAMQALLDASIRNLYAIAETVGGHMQFEPGPSVYRGLWVHDAVWHNSAALMLGDTEAVRSAIAGLLRYQKQNGQVEVMAPYPMNRETPLVLFLLSRYARLTNNRVWLEQHWSAMQRGIRWLWDLRRSTMTTPRPLFYGLFPPGFSDGGLSGIEPEYASVYWGLVGLSSASNAARWLGHNDDASRWSGYFDELLASFRNAASRDQRTDRFGNPYLPMKVGDTSATTPPQLANWGILDAQGLGHIFPADDPLLRGTLRMLRADTSEGLPPNTGWLKDGLWPFFGSLEAIAHLYQRDNDAATDLLYAVANHASPTWTWVEEQLPRGAGTKTTGDASNATASALFIKLIRRMIVLERDSTMDLLAGVPAGWYRAGAHMEVKGIPTLFGQCTFRLDIAADSSRATLIVNPMRDGAAQGTVLLATHALKQAGFTMRQGKPAPDVLRFASDKGFRVVLMPPH